MTNEILKQYKSEYEKLQDQINDLQRQMQTKAKVLMHEAFKDFFTKYNSVVDSIYWTQFQPFFNDGEACEFSVNDVFILLKDDEDACDYEGSSLYSEDDIVNLKSKIADIEAWEKDPMAAARKHQAEYMKRYNLDPFDVRNSYTNRSKTSEDLMREWKPRYASKENYQQELHTAELILSKYPNLKDDFKEIKSMISKIDDDLMKAMFGDHVKVIVTKDEIETEEYSHD